MTHADFQDFFVNDLTVVLTHRRTECFDWLIRSIHLLTDFADDSLPGFPGTDRPARFQKTFVERQSWLVPIFSFWRVSPSLGIHYNGTSSTKNIRTLDVKPK